MVEQRFPKKPGFTFTGKVEPRFQVGAELSLKAALCRKRQSAHNLGRRKPGARGRQLQQLNFSFELRIRGGENLPNESGGGK